MERHDVKRALREEVNAALHANAEDPLAAVAAGLLRRSRSGGDARVGEAAAAPSTEFHSEDQPASSADGGGWTGAAWVGSLGLHHVIANALQLPAANPFEHATTKLKGELFAKLRASAFLDALEKGISAGIDTLVEQAAPTAADLASKFADEASFELQQGDMGVFYSGLEGVAGTPTMRNGGFFDQLKHEHCSSTDSELPYATPQTKGVRTQSPGLQPAVLARWAPGGLAAHVTRTHTSWGQKAKVVPKVQWLYVMEGRDGARAEGQDDGTFDIGGRNGEPLSHYVAKMEEKNALLLEQGHVPIVKEELIGMRLYSGPQYAKCMWLGAQTCARPARVSPILA